MAGVADVSGGSAGTPTQPPVNRSVGAADVGRFAAAHPGELVAALGAIGYLLGYLNVRLAAAGLGVAADDLALNTNDYVVVALAWTVFFAVFAVGYVVQLRLVRKAGWRSSTGSITAAAGIGLGVTAVVIAGSALSARCGLRDCDRPRAVRRHRLVGGRSRIGHSDDGGPRACRTRPAVVI